MDPERWPIFKLESILYFCSSAIMRINGGYFSPASIYACAIESICIRWKLPFIKKLAGEAYLHCQSSRSKAAIISFIKIANITKERMKQVQKARRKP